MPELQLASFWRFEISSLKFLSIQKSLYSWKLNVLEKLDCIFWFVWIYVWLWEGASGPCFANFFLAICCVPWEELNILTFKYVLHKNLVRNLTNTTGGAQYCTGTVVLRLHSGGWLSLTQPSSHCPPVGCGTESEGQKRNKTQNTAV